MIYGVADCTKSNMRVQRSPLTTHCGEVSSGYYVEIEQTNLQTSELGVLASRTRI